MSCFCHYFTTTVTSSNKFFASSNLWHVLITLLAWVKKTTVWVSLWLSKLGNTGLSSWWSSTHSLEECSTSRVAPHCGHLPLSPSRLTSTPAVGQWTCNLVAAGHQLDTHTHTYTTPSCSCPPSHSVCLSATATSCLSDEYFNSPGLLFLATARNLHNQACTFLVTLGFTQV